MSEMMTEAMHLAWVVTCTRCKAEQAVEHPDDIGVAATYLQDEGWTARREPHPYKNIMAPHMDVSAYPDQVTVVLCPWCSK